MEVDMDGPALAPPEGVVPNLENPPNQNGLALGVFIASSIISTVCLALRAYGRVYLLRKVQTEDVLALLAYGCYWGSAWACFKLVETPGFFVNQWNVRLRDTIPMTYYVFVFGVFYSFVLPFLKIAILIEWCRVFVPHGMRTKSPFWWGCAIIIFIQTTANIAIIVALNLQCIPHEAIWDFTIEGQCFELFNLQVFSAVLHLASDVAIFLLPQRTIWKLNMSWKKRLGVSFIFSLGILACVAASFRVAVTVQSASTDDGVYSIGLIVLWAHAELTCGFFIVCVPCLPKIFKESGALHGIKKRLGMSKTGGTAPSKKNEYSDRYAGNTSQGKMPSTTTSKSYYKLDEEGVPMTDLKHDGTESTENLRNDPVGGDNRDNSGIVRTTRITVTNSADSSTHGNDIQLPVQMQPPHHGHPTHGWAR